MAGASLVISRRQLANGVGQTTRENRVLPFAALAVQIPARVGIFDPGAPPLVIAECIGSDFTSDIAHSPTDIASAHGSNYPYPTNTYTLRSADGLLRYDVRKPKRLPWFWMDSTTSGSVAVVNGSSPAMDTLPAVDAVEDPAAPAGSKQFVEHAYASRLWWPVATGYMPLGGTIAGIRRLKRITFSFGPQNFSWNFANDNPSEPADPPPGASGPVCMNSDISEPRVSDRVFDKSHTGLTGGQTGYAYRLRNISLFSSAGKQGKIIFSLRKFGMFPCFSTRYLSNEYFSSDETRNNQTVYTSQIDPSIDAQGKSTTNATDLSEILSIGQPYHGLCTATNIYVDASKTTLATKALLHLPPTSGDTRYFKSPLAPGLKEDPLYIGHDPLVPDYSVLPPDYVAAGYKFCDDVVLASGRNYAPVRRSADSNAAAGLSISNRQWLVSLPTGEVWVFGLVLDAWAPTYHRFKIYHYGQVRQIDYSGVSAASLYGTITITSTDPYVATLPNTSGRGGFGSIGNPDYQVDQYVAPVPAAIAGDNTTLPPGYIGYPTNVATSFEFKVEANKSGTQIAISRHFNRIDSLTPGSLKYTYWNQHKYAHAIANVTILTVATVDLIWNSGSGFFDIGPVTDVFQWQHHAPPTDFASSAEVNSRAVYKSLGTWWFSYELSSMSASGTPYTLRECTQYCYAPDGTLKLSYYERDYGPVTTNFHNVGNVEHMMIDSGVADTSAAPAFPYANGATVTQGPTYPINGGFGWGMKGDRFSLHSAPADRLDAWGGMYYRLTNNVQMVSTYHDGANFYLPYEFQNDIFYPNGRTPFESVFTEPPTNTRFTSYDPRSGALGTSEDASNTDISWV